MAEQQTEDAAVARPLQRDGYTALNERQKRALAALRTTHSHIGQFDDESAAWHLWHPEHYRVRLNLTVRDVHDLKQRGLLTPAGPWGDEFTLAV